MLGSTANSDSPCKDYSALPTTRLTPASSPPRHSRRPIFLRSSAIFPILFKIDIKGAEVEAASALSPLLKSTADIAHHTRAAVAAIKRGAHGNETNIWLQTALSLSADAVRTVSNLPDQDLTGPASPSEFFL